MYDKMPKNQIDVVCVCEAQPDYTLGKGRLFKNCKCDIESDAKTFGKINPDELYVNVL